MGREFKTTSALGGGRLFKTLASPLRPAQLRRLNNNESKWINTRLPMTTQGLKSSKHTQVQIPQRCVMSVVLIAPPLQRETDVSN